MPTNTGRFVPILDDAHVTRDLAFPVRPAGRMMKDAHGKPIRIRGLSAFPLADRVKRNIVPSGYWDWASQFNYLRVWPYVDWPGTGWEHCGTDGAQKMLDATRERKQIIEMTLLTSDETRRLQQAQSFALALASTGNVANLWWEAGNEPKVHKNIDTAALQSVLNATGLPHGSGDSSDLWYGTQFMDHPPRDWAWARKFKGLSEVWSGDGPDMPHAPRNVPAWEDEPIREDEALAEARHHRFLKGITDLAELERQARLLVEQQYYTFGAGCAMFGSGCVFHCTSGKYCTLPSDFERRCATALLRGLDSLPEDFVLVNDSTKYRRITEGDPKAEDTTWNALRTYVVGPNMIRVEPKTKEAPEPGWTAMDEDGILWRR